MLRILKTFLWVGLLVAGSQRASAFVLGGPVNEAYQVPTIAYDLPGDINAPKNLGEEYRRNTPTMFYAFDQNFLDYFGSNGVYAVDQAFAIYNTLTNVSSYSADLSEFPYESQSHNYRADALQLIDLKSATMTLLIENLGLAEPVRYTWTLHDRYLPSGGVCPQDEIYLVIKRNWEIGPTPLDQLQPSSYVNGTLYSYFIQEFCTGPDPLAEAVEFPVDPLASIYTPLAEYIGLDLGGYYQGLTRDDVAGLRYLLRANNMNVEATGQNTSVAVTNLGTSQLLFTSNLTQFVNEALTNNAAALQALYPDLVITGTTPIFTNLVTTNIFFYFTNFPWSPAGVTTLVGATNRTTNVVTWFKHGFANVVTNTYYTNGWVTVLETNITTCAWGNPGAICTNVTATTMWTNFINGDYYILPTNSACGVSIIHTQLFSILTTTNVPNVATNATGTTNTTEQYSQSFVFHFTNRVYVVHPVPCVDNPVGLRQGIERIRFVRRDFDSLLGTFYEPITNLYTLVAVTNNAPLPQTVIRRITQPDFLFTAVDLAAGPAEVPATPYGARNLNFSGTNIYVGLAGPGTIETPTLFTFNKVGPIYQNPGLLFFATPPFTEGTHELRFIWGSFDGSTNAPVVYPNGTSVINLENQVFIQVSPDTLPDGTVGSPYNLPFSVSGGQSPFTWSLSPDSAGLPSGLILSPAGVLSGTPAVAATYDISIRVTDGGGRTVDRPYTLEINP